MPPSMIEAGIGDLWYAKQSALGTIAPTSDAGTVRLRKVGDNAFKSGKTFGSEPYVDGQAIDDPNIYVSKIGGPIGTATHQSQPSTAGRMWAQAIAVDIVTGSGDPYTHTMALGTVQPPYGTWRQRVGQAVGPWAEAFWDSKISKTTWTCGQDQEVAHIDQDVIALKAGEVFTTAPTATDGGDDSWNWNEVTGNVKIGGTSFPEISGEVIELDRKLDVHDGDDTAPTAIFATKGTLTRTFNGVVTDTMIAQMQAAIWGASAPVAGTRPSNTVTQVALSTKYTRSATRTLQIDTPAVAIDPADWEVGPRVAGGKIPVAFGGVCKRSSGGTVAAITVTAKTADSGAYV